MLNLKKRFVTIIQALLVAVVLLGITTQPAFAAECKPFENVTINNCTCPGEVTSNVCFIKQSLDNQGNIVAPGGLKNPAIPANLGSNAKEAQAGITFTTYFVYLWRVIIFIGGITVIIFYLQAAIDWINAAGDQAKVSKAREKITNATIGLIILMGSFLLISFISSAIGYDLLNPVLPKI